MIMDIHLHEKKYSPDSITDLNEAIATARLRGLNGICVTNHENNYMRNEIGDYVNVNGILVVVGAEVLTHEGDILVFGLRDIPKDKVSAHDLLSLVKKHNGVAIAAHPYRHNNRGLKDNLYKVGHLLDAVEAFNGSTYYHHNLQAFSVATELNLPSTGAGDSHNLENIGKYATKFYNTIRDEKDFIEAIKSKNFHPVMRKNEAYMNFDYAHKAIMSGAHVR